MKLPIGFKAGGLHTGIYKDPKKPDLALFYSLTPCLGTAVFTTNQVKAAPILVSQRHIKNRTLHAIIANSGCANACTGEQGLKDAEQMCQWTAQALGLKQEHILAASTGVIGQPLPMTKIKTGISQLAEHLKKNSDPESAVRAIMTTDTFPKSAGTKYSVQGKTITIWACAKGSGMIHPNMATMFSFILTDALLPRDYMKKILKSTADKTFNALSVDGDTSTNDCVFFLANGASCTLKSRNELERFAAELEKVCQDLAGQMASDGEGATKRIEITVKGARRSADAKRIAETVATSPLVKTAMFGEDANWGRIMAAIGRSGVPLNPNKIEISFDHLCVARNGCAASFSETKAKKILQQKVVPLTIDLHQGHAEMRYLTCDFSLDYVKINADYRS